MTRPTIFVTHGPAELERYFGARALAALQAIADVRCNPCDEIPNPTQLAAAAQHCDIIASDRRVAAPAELFARLPQLVALCRCALDVRNIDSDAASAHGVLVTHASAGFMSSVTEWVVGMLVDLSRYLSDAVLEYRAGAQPLPPMGRELRGATLGIVGYGQIGRTLADVALALGMRVVVSDPHAQVDNPALQLLPLAALLAASDHVVCLAVANEQTENLFGAAAFAAMRPGACFVNPSRGNLVDEAALLQALDSGHLAGCALDVGRAPDQMPSLALARHPRVLATPHIGGLTLPAIEHQSLEVVQQIGALLQGRVPHGALNAPQASRLQAFFERAASR